MTTPTSPPLDDVLAIDIGATNIKFCRVDSRGELLESVRRKPTPYPCSPERLVELLGDRILHSDVSKVGVGFPGEFDDGHVVQPGNLSRPGGVATDVDPELEARWIGFPLQEALGKKVHRDVRVVNDAKLAALGCVTGEGIEVVLTLGTGLGLALCVEGTMRRVRDVGREVFRDGHTFDQLIGERSRATDEGVWLGYLHDVIEMFGHEFGANIVHLAGGNARRIEPDQFPDLPFRIVINGNQAPLRGAARLFYG
jgi:polyphosphate glucokinase